MNTTPAAISKLALLLMLLMRMINIAILVLMKHAAVEDDIANQQNLI